MLEITKYWNKIEPSKPLNKVITDEYDIQTRFKIDGSLKELKERYKDHPRMEIFDDHIKEDNGKYYGIHSYTIIKEINPNGL